MRSLLDGAFVTKRQGRRYDFEIDLRVTFVFFSSFSSPFHCLVFTKYVVQFENMLLKASGSGSISELSLCRSIYG
jgi:hypothetical protein